MAGETLNTILSAVSQIFAPQIKRQWNRTTYFLGALNASKGVSEGKGKNVAFDVEFTGATAATVAEGADIAASEYTTDPVVPMILPWATYRSSFQISEQEVDALRSAMGTADALMDLLGERVMNAAAILARTIEQDAISGTGVDSNGNPTLIGIFGGALTASGGYGGINPGTYSEWAANVIANGGVSRSLTPDLMDQADSQIFTASSLPWNLIVTTAGVVRKYVSMFQTGTGVNNFPLIRMNDNPAAPAYGMGVPNNAQMQMDALMFKGRNVLRNPVAPSGQLAFLNTDHIAIKYLPHYPTRNEFEFFQNIGLEGSSGGGEPVQVTGIPTRLIEVAKTGDSHKISMRATLAMAVTRRNAMAIVKDIAET